MTRETPVEAFKQASEEFNAALTALMTRAEAYGVEVPWQIRFAAERSKDGKVELKGMSLAPVKLKELQAEGLLTKMETIFGKQNVSRCAIPTLFIS